MDRLEVNEFRSLIAESLQEAYERGLEDAVKIATNVAALIRARYKAPMFVPLKDLEAIETARAIAAETRALIKNPKKADKVVKGFNQ